ncbi:MAG TPA: VCBS repeat-containing protein [Pirellulaceae bacterium]|nr:VCBS repeat-containing protein [Pirellulaceae bacterium]
MGFGPQLVDLDGDGRVDLLSGTWVYRIIFFQRQEDGAFAAGRALTHPDGKDIHVDYGTAVFAADWDADEDLDLIVGTAAGHIYLVSNNGSRAEPAWGMPQKLQADGKEIEIPAGGDAGPAVVDWDGDGKLDVLSGTSDGSVLFFRNVGTSREPKLAAVQTIVPAPAAGSQRGQRSKICVTDWNEDGKLDLVIGDCGDQFQKAFSPEEQAWLTKTHETQSDFLSQWAHTFAEYRRLLKTAAPTVESPAKERERKLAALRDELKRLNKLREQQGREEQALREQNQYHGRVWIVLRK